MKKLLSILVVALILSGFIITLCEKENPAHAPMHMETATTFTPTGTTNNKTVKGKIEEEEREIV